MWGVPGNIIQLQAASPGYTGSWLVDRGWLQAKAAGALGSGTVTIGNGTNKAGMDFAASQTGVAGPAIVVNANWRDNPWFGAELEQERLDCLRMTPDDYEHVWEGGYVTVASGAYFAKHLTAAKAESRIGRVAADPLMTLRLFVDIGGTGAKADSFVIWVAQFIGKEIRWLDYYEAQGQPLATHLNWLRSKGYTPDRAQFWLPHDGSTQDKVFDVSYESALRAAGYQVTVIPNQGKGAASARIEAARRLFPSMWFNAETTEPGRDALGWYHEKRDEARGIGLGPEHDWASHGADAFGLGCVAYEEPMSKDTSWKFKARKVV
jgi:phage terminase large subunit